MNFLILRIFEYYFLKYNKKEYISGNYYKKSKIDSNSLLKDHDTYFKYEWTNQ